MRTWTETHREGTDVGPIDWSHPWIDEWLAGFHGRNYTKELLRALEAEPGRFRATSDGGSPRCGIHRVLTFCMYDGWPYWTPHPALLTAGVLGPEWHPLNSITDIYEDERT